MSVWYQRPTKAQQLALRRVWERDWHDKPASYIAFRRSAIWSFGCLIVPFAGMALGIEPDGIIVKPSLLAIALLKHAKGELMK